MSHGGKRQGAGRKRGSLSQRTQEIVAKASEDGILPLEYLLKTLRDENQSHDERFKAAVSAAPYMHPKLASVQHSGDQENPLALAIMASVPRADADDDDQRPNPQSH